MRVFIAAADKGERTKLADMFERHHWVVVAPNDVDTTEIENGEYKGALDAVVGSLSGNLSQKYGLPQITKIGDFGMFFAHFLKASEHPTAHIDIRTAKQGGHELLIHMLNNSVRVNGRPVDLTSVEYNLLRQFVSKPETTHSTKTLAPRAGITENMVAFHINNLRDKILPFEIQAVRGMGYSFPDESSRHGITAHVDGRIVYAGHEGDVAIELVRGSDMLRQLLRDKSVPISPKNVKDEQHQHMAYIRNQDMAYIRKQLAKASRCPESPQGYDFFVAEDGHYRLRDEPEANPKGMLFSLGDGRLIVDTHKHILRHRDNNETCILSRQQCRFFEALASRNSNQRLTYQNFERKYNIIGVNKTYQRAGDKIKALGLTPEDYVQSGNKTTPGYRLINMQPLETENDPGVGVGANPHTPSAE